MNEKKEFKEIDIIGILKKVFSEKRLLVIFLSVFAVIGVVVALCTPKQYTSTVVLAPEITGMGMSQSLGDLASMVGVNLGTTGSSTDAIYPDIYPDVFASNDFIIRLFNVNVSLLDAPDNKKTYYDHLVEDTQIPFWQYPMMWVKSLFAKEDDGGNGKKMDPFRLTKIQDGVCNDIKKNIACLIDKKTNVITISVTDYDPLVSALMADTIQSLLQDYIIEYRTQKARNDMDFAKKTYVDAKEQYVKAQQLYSSYMDANSDVVLQSFKSKQEELENEMQLRYNIYNQSVQQLQMAKMKVQERTPAFTIIQEATVPLRASSTPRSMIVVIYMFFGFFLDIVWILWGQNLFSKMRG